MTTSDFVTETTTTTIGSLAVQTTTLETTSSDKCDGVCGCEWKPFSIDGKTQCFKLAGRYKLDQAERECQERGAKLPLPENQKQNADMLIAFKKMTDEMYKTTKRNFMK